MKSLSILFTSLLVTPFLLVNAVNNLTVDCKNKLRGATHCANGSLYGLIENKPADYTNLVAPLHPYVFRNPGRGGNGNQHPYGDAIKVAKRLKESPGALMSVDLADILPNWPYRWPGLNAWLNEVKSFINDKKASGLDNWYGLEIWNEPDGTWSDANGSFNDMWKETFKVIRQNDPGEKIIGPCFSWYEENKMRNFLQYAKANDCVPDIISWHELSGIDGVSSHLRAYRSLEKSLGIPELPISINEYCDAEHELEGQPGSSARFIGKFERYKVDSAMITWWFVPQPGRLGSLLATDTQKGAGWYFYKWYGDMTGDMVYVTPPNDNSKLVDGAACVDDSQEYISFIFGGPNDGTINANFENIPSFIGSKALVKAEKIDWKNKDTVSNGPNTIFEKEYDVANGKLSINLTGCNASSGYRIYITSASGSSAGKQTVEQPVTQPVTQPVITAPAQSDDGIVSGGKYVIINRNSGKALSVANDSTANEANVQQWSENNKTSQQWIITDEGGNYSIVNVNANKALDVDNNSRVDGGNIIIWTNNNDANQRWYIKEIGGGYVTITNVNSNKLLDVDNGSISDGGNVLQWSANNGNNQQWKLVRVDAPKQSEPVKQNDPPKQNEPPKQSDTPILDEPPKPTKTPTCSSAITKQGYKCCSSGCTVYYTDSDGEWGVENGEWCGCGGGSTNNTPVADGSCPSGYKCCKADNDIVYYIDDAGEWGIENGEWCFIIS